MDFGDLTGFGVGLGLPAESEEADLHVLVEQVEGLFNSLSPGEFEKRTSFG